MDVVNSTEYSANGGMKDTEFLAKQFIPVMQKIDRRFELFDMIAFDSVTNVQKGVWQLQKGSSESCDSWSRPCKFAIPVKAF